MPQKQKRKIPKAELSKTIKQLSDIALTITHDRKLTIRYKPKEKTAFYEPLKNRITITSQALPKGIDKYPRIHNKLLDGLTAHECGHRIITLPNYDRFKRFEEQQKFQKLAHVIVNIMEDKRVNHFIETRYRFDVGKRLRFYREVTKDMGDKELKYFDRKILRDTNQGILLLGTLVNKGLYDADTKHLEAFMKTETKKQAKTLLKLLEDVQYTRIKHYLVKTAKNMYDIIAEHLESEDGIGQFIPTTFEEGEMTGELSEALKKKLEQEERDMEEQEKLKEDLEKGAGAGKGTGEEIPAPEPDFDKYLGLVERNSSEIQRLLNKLKQFIRPTVIRRNFQKRGRLMHGIVAKAYTASLSRDVHRIYETNRCTFEKQKVAISILIDFSGSMDFSTSCNVCTILNEVFGAWLEDKAYSLLVFGADYQKIKTFHEAFANTRARVGGISVDAGGTRAHEPLLDIARMFATVEPFRHRILVFASDYAFGDETETLEAIKMISKMGVTILFVGLCGYSRMNSFAKDVKHIYRTEISNVSDLPELFIQAYLDGIMGK